ncbi:MAG: alkaline phosphatase D family protein [Chloroflexota bacterium]|nr:alkaline phosphatase D family protein [Chloroflexota bacterium]
MFEDLLLGPIVGGLDESRVHLWGRADHPGRLRAWLWENGDLDGEPLTGESLPLTAENCFAGVVPFLNLKPQTTYSYALSLNDVPPAPEDGAYPSFTTFPPNGKRESFSFSFGSCFYPTTPESGQAFAAMDAYRKEHGLAFGLFLGDQIYADEYGHNGIGRVALTLQDYRDVYAHVWGYKPFRKLLWNLPAFMILDDHEVDDDWAWTDSTRTKAKIPFWDVAFRIMRGRPSKECRLSNKRVQAALQAYWEHQGMHAPHFELPLKVDDVGAYRLETGEPGSLAYTFEYGAAAFFVLDTRTMRVKGKDERTMLGKGQWAALKEWLITVNDRYPVKFLVSSCALLFDMWIDIARDRWSGFPEERDHLLHFLAANEIENLFVLAGDLHSAHALHVNLFGPTGGDIPLWEFCSSPFEQECNWLSRYTYAKLNSGVVKNQELCFLYSENNFGVVNVDFDEDGKAVVTYSLHAETGEAVHSVVGG